MPSPPLPESPLRAVTLDLDGLMFNTEELYQEVGGTLLARRGHQITGDLLDQMMGRKSNLALQVMIDWHQLEDTPEQLAAESAEIFGGILPVRLRPLPGVMELLDALEAANIPKGIATSSSRAFVTEVLRIFDMEPRFSFVLSGDDIEHGKPAPDVYLTAAGRHGIAAPEMMVLEDSHIGASAAVASGAYAIAVPHGRSKQHEFPGVKFVADSMADPRIYAALGL